MMLHLRQVQRIHAGNNGVYDAVFSKDAAEWLIRYAPYNGYYGSIALLCTTVWDDRTDEPTYEYSVTGYDSAHTACLAWERGQVTYQTLAQIRSVA